MSKSKKIVITVPEPLYTKVVQRSNSVHFKYKPCNLVYEALSQYMEGQAGSVPKASSETEEANTLFD